MPNQVVFGTASEPALNEGAKYWTFDRDITYLKAVLSNDIIPGGLVEFLLSNPLAVSPHQINVPLWAKATLKLEFDNSPCRGKPIPNSPFPQQCPSSSSYPAPEAIPLLAPGEVYLPAIASISGAGDGG